MKPDFNDTFDPADRYLRVRQQQGEVQTDADWNETGAIDGTMRAALSGPGAATGQASDLLASVLLQPAEPAPDLALLPPLPSELLAELAAVGPPGLEQMTSLEIRLEAGRAGLLDQSGIAGQAVSTDSFHGDDAAAALAGLAGLLRETSQWRQTVDAARAPGQGCLQTKETPLPAAGHDISGQAFRHLAGIASRVEMRHTWADLPLPHGQQDVLRAAIASAREMLKPSEDGSPASNREGSGAGAVTVWLSGAGGTGKTMAAEIIAGELGLDLYRIDLGAVVSKFIGETEKNLQRVFDAAENAGVILLFDEADTLFGDRTEAGGSGGPSGRTRAEAFREQCQSFDGVAILSSRSHPATAPENSGGAEFVVDFDPDRLRATDP